LEYQIPLTKPALSDPPPAAQTDDKKQNGITATTKRITQNFINPILPISEQPSNHELHHEPDKNPRRSCIATITAQNRYQIKILDKESL